ncbi:MAG: hypothetical protein H0T46_01790 [Deltaproteobacteria bacterium]|nr:hypothetical protein [Deltaproteobacteria bacterium]
MRSASAQAPIQKPTSKAALEHLDKGNKLYNVRSWTEASEEFKAGALIDPAPIFDYNLGQCYRKLKRYDDAIWHYERFIKTNPQAGHVATAEKHIADMKAELQRTAITEPPSESAPTTTRAPVPTAAPAASIPAASVVVRRASREAWYADGLGWGLAGSGVIALAASAGFLWNARGLDDEASRVASQSEAERLHETADTRRLLGRVIGIGGAALLVTGIITLAIHPANDGSPPVASIAVSEHGLLIYGRF